MNRGSAVFLRDNLEAFAVAIAMALVIRHYCIEAFRIPTASMMPTLLGDHRGASGKRLHGDRILVDKFVYLRRDPRRYEVVVFRYPLNAGKNFIKRLIGLPGEWMRIVDGDIWTSTDEGATWAIQRKPPGVRDRLLFPYHPQPENGRRSSLGGGDPWKAGAGWRRLADRGAYAVAAQGEPSALRFDRRVMPFPHTDDSRSARPPYVGDVRVRCDVEVERAGRLTVLLQEHGEAHRLVLGASESYAVVVRDGKEHRFEVDARLEPDQRFDLSFANVDDMLVIELEGDLSLGLEIPYPDPPDEPPLPSMFEDRRYGRHEISIEADNLAATLSGLSVDRDLHYNFLSDAPTKVWKVPADHFFMLGDNTGSSKDSRVWEVAEAHHRSGEIIRWEPNTGDGIRNPYAGDPDLPPDAQYFVQADVDGLTRRFRVGDVVDWPTGVSRPFVPRDHLIGRAFSTFWPIFLPPLYSGPTRVGLIH